MTKLWAGSVFKSLRRCFFRVMTPVENENCFSSKVLPSKLDLFPISIEASVNDLYYSVYVNELG